MVKDISIIIPLYNKEKYISATIKSVLAQTYKDFELLVVDDGSTDGSADIVKSFNDERIRYIRKENGGVSSARNRGVVEAIGDWILFLDADDTLESRCLETLLVPIESNRDVDISAASFFIERHGSKSVDCHTSYNGIVPSNYKWLFLKKYFLRAGSFLIRRDIVMKNKFDESLSRYEDMKCVLEWIRNTKIYVLDIPVMTYQTGNSSLSSMAKDFSRDFIFNMSFKGKGFWEKCILGGLLYQGLIGYPHVRFEMLKIYKWKMLYALIAKTQMLANHMKRIENHHMLQVIIGGGNCFAIVSLGNSVV